MLLFAPLIEAGQGASLWQTPQGQHVVLDRGSAMDGLAIRRVRPIPLSSSVATDVGVLGNVRVELPRESGCGFADRERLVICLDTGWQMSEAEQLRVLALAAQPYRVSAGSQRALDVVHDLVQARAEAPGRALETIRTMSDCAGACDRRVELEAR